MENNNKQYVRMLKALADETRLQIVEMLSGGELCACKLLESFKITQPTLSYHMKILTECGLVNGNREGVWMHYSINKDEVQKIVDLFNHFNIDENSKATNESTEKC